MSKDNLSPDSSPKTLEVGVKKVNNIPLIIVISIVTIFALLIAMIALKKAQAQNIANQPYQKKLSKQDSLSLARDVIKNAKRSERGSKKLMTPVTESMPAEIAPPAPEVSTTDMPTLTSSMSDTEIERIRQEKTQAFEEAVKAKTTVQVDKELLNPKNNQANNGLGALMNNSNPSIAFKEQLRLLQSANGQSQTASSLGGQENEDRWQLKSHLQSPKTPFELKTGGVIPGILISGIRSELTGQIIGQVSQDVYDTATGNHLLIPQGTKLIGVYSNDVKFGQDSVLVAWQRLIFPDGKALDIGGMSGTDSAGYAGFRDEVDHHYARIYGSAILMSGIVAGISYSQSRNQANQNGIGVPSTGDILSQALGQQLGQTTSQLIAKNINTAPTINIRPGYQFNVIVTKDLVFKRPYSQFSY
jgi:type IV secretion system protein VirB10